MAPCNTAVYASSATPLKPDPLTTSTTNLTNVDVMLGLTVVVTGYAGPMLELQPAFFAVTNDPRGSLAATPLGQRLGVRASWLRQCLAAHQRRERCERMGGRRRDPLR